MREPNAQEYQQVAAFNPERMQRRMVQQTKHDACRELVKHLGGTGWAFRATNAQLKAGAKTLYAMARKRNELLSAQMTCQS